MDVTNFNSPPKPSKKKSLPKPQSSNKKPKPKKRKKRSLSRKTLNKFKRSNREQKLLSDLEHTFEYSPMKNRYGKKRRTSTYKSPNVRRNIR